MGKQTKNKLGTERSTAILHHEATLLMAARNFRASTRATEYEYSLMRLIFSGHVSDILQNHMSYAVEEHYTYFEAEQTQVAKCLRDDQNSWVCQKSSCNSQREEKSINSVSIAYCQNHRWISILGNSHHVFPLSLLARAADKIITINKPLIDLITYPLIQRISYAQNFR